MGKASITARLFCAFFVLLAAGAVGGCAREQASPIRTRATSYLMFGAEPSAGWATQIGRDAWPATFGAFETPEKTVFLETYYDRFGGNANTDRFYPQRTFRSYSVGASQR